MKKLLLIILSLMLLTSCGAKKDGAETKVLSAEEQAAYNFEKLNQTQGTYLSRDYVEKFKETKSIQKSSNMFGAFTVNGTTLILMSGKEGTYDIIGEFAKVKEVEGGGYLMDFTINDAALEKVNIHYNPEYDRYSLYAGSKIPVWTSEDLNFVLEKHEEWDLEFEKILFEGMKTVVLEGNIFKLTNSGEYTIADVYVTPSSYQNVDITLGAEDDGIIELRKSADEIPGNGTLGKYRYKDGKITVYDSNDEVITVIE